MSCFGRFEKEVHKHQRIITLISGFRLFLFSRCLMSLALSEKVLSQIPRSQETRSGLEQGPISYLESSFFYCVGLTKLSNSLKFLHRIRFCFLLGAIKISGNKIARRSCIYKLILLNLTVSPIFSAFKSELASWPLVKGNEDAGYEGEQDLALNINLTSRRKLGLSLQSFSKKKRLHFVNTTLFQSTVKSVKTANFPIEKSSF